MKKISTFSVIVFAFVNVAVSGNTYYVSNSGSNSNSGTSTLPFKTITYAYTKVGAGDAIIVKPGTYTDYTPGVGLQFSKNGTPAQPITIRSEVKWGAILDGGNVTDHIEVVTLYGSYHIVDGFEMKNGYEGGVYVAGSAKGNQLLNNHIHHNGNIGNISGNTGQDGVLSEPNTSETTYYGNYIHHNGRLSINSNLDHGMYLTGDNEIVANNIVTHNSSYGLHIAGYDTVSHMRVYNNVFAFNGTSGAMLWMDMEDILFINNIFYKNKDLGISTYDAHGTGIVIDQNMWYGNPNGTILMTWAGSDVSYTSGNNLINVDPLFVNELSDYHLQPGSPAIDAGVTLSPTVIDDVDGVSRPQGNWFDMGPYELPVNATGVHTLQTDRGVILFPNPTTGCFTISGPEPDSEIILFNLMGERIAIQNSNPGIFSFDISSEPKGIYLVKITSGSEVNAGKIILK